GLGAVRPYGAGVAEYWKGLAGGACAIRDLTLIETDGFRFRLAGEVPEPLPGSARRTRADRLAIAAAGEALADAGLGARDCAAATLVVGAVGGGMLEAEAWYWRTARAGVRPASLSALRAVLPSAHAEALGGGGITPADVQYANAHGTGTPQNDRIEARALARVFGEGGLLVSSSKSMIGHTMAAAGSLEAIATVLALGHDLVPPTANLAT